ncbi:MAG: 2-oxoacid:acceptor oxidoreductase subunit alpha [Pseudomonadota bacterium]
MENLSTNVVIAGEAGQGLVTISQILTRTLVRAGYHIVVTQSYQSRIRGGHNSYALRISHAEIVAPKESLDLLVALDQNSINIHLPELSDHGLILVDEKISSTVHPQVIRAPLANLADDKFSNSVALGMVACILGLDKGKIIKTLREFFDKHAGSISDHNAESLSVGFDWILNHPVEFPKLPLPVVPEGRLTLNGNEAIALGSITAGMKFFAFYPMTPATSIATALAGHATQMEFVIEQAEDEISAINMAVGASFAGAPSMVATSGGGFALMAETVSLTGMTETPVVIVVAQRPGPSTGLPTRTEQGDLEFVLHSGHGEFPRAIFAPGDVEQCFHLAIRAFQIAQKYNIPVFLLTDQYLADSYRSVGYFDLDQLAPLTPCLNSSIPANRHLSYLLTESGVSPRIFPGMSSQCVRASSSSELVIADSDEHTQDGHLTEDLSVRISMVEKRLRKLDGVKSEVVGPEFIGEPGPETLFVTWGSSRGSVMEAADILVGKGRSVATLNFLQVWPLIPENFFPILAAAKNVVAVEGNATAQFARLIRRETGFHITKTITRFDGLPITPEYILDRV